MRSGFNLTQISLHAGSRFDSHARLWMGVITDMRGLTVCGENSLTHEENSLDSIRSGSMCSSAASHLLLIVIFPD